jgi:protein-disulfide isomerase
MAMSRPVHRLAIAGWSACLITLLCPPLLAQPMINEDLQSLRKEIETLKQGQQAMQSDLREIKQLLAARPSAGQPTAVGAVVRVEGRPVRGEATARVTLIEVSEYQCPYCARYRRDTAPLIDREYVKTGKVRYVFHDLPLKFHPYAQHAAEAAYCAGEQQKYWEMQDELFAHQDSLAPGRLPAYAAAAGADTGRFQACLRSGRYGSHIAQSAADANKIGLTGTPSFLLGLTEPGSPGIKVLKVIIGAKAISEFRAAIDELLAMPGRPEATKPPR